MPSASIGDADDVVALITWARPTSWAATAAPARSGRGDLADDLVGVARRVGGHGEPALVQTRSAGCTISPAARLRA